MDRRTLVIVPTYNERDNLERLARNILDALPGCDLLVVDDASPDLTGLLADRMAETEPRIDVIHREAKAGLGTAYLVGFRHALERGYDTAVQMDADFSHDPRHLPGLVARLDGADLVIGSRTVEGGGVVGWSRDRLALSRAGGAYCRAILDMPLGDPTSGFRALDARALRAIVGRPPRSEGFAFQVEVAYRALRSGLVVVEHPIVFVDRTAGSSKLSPWIVAEALLVVPLLRGCAELRVL